MPSRPAKRRAPTARRTAATSTGARRAAARSHGRRRRFSVWPSPAVLGATALVVAGAGAVIVSSGTEETPPLSPYATMAANFDGSDAVSYGRASNAVSVSRDIDRDTLEQQAELQAQQRTTALAQLARKSQERANQLQLNQWVLPVAGYHLSAAFGESSYLWTTVHTGLDFAAPSGTPIVSAAYGTVTEATYDGAYGYKTVVTLADGTEIWYAHQTSNLVAVGHELNPGELIGYVGSTGNVTGPHLHLEVRPGGGDPVDPYAALVSHGVTP